MSISNLSGPEDDEDPSHSHGTRVWAPFTPDQVQALNLFQNSYWHPFTCPYRARPGHGTGDLVAAREGWYCPDRDCDHTQDWAHDFMADLEWVRTETARMREIFSRPTPPDA
jgi:hypothetical protein